MIPQENSALTVIRIDNKPNRKRTIEHYDYDTAQTEQEAINLVSELRAKIDSKETEVARLREALQRDNEISLPETVEKLKQLQSAFDQVQKMCANRINPIELEYNRACAHLDGRNNFINTFEKESNERHQALDRINKAADTVMAKLNDPSVNEVDESPLYPLFGKCAVSAFDLDCGKRSIAFEAAKEQKYLNLNDSLKRLFNEAIDRENKSERRHKTAKKDLKVRCQTQKPVVITPDYLKAQKEYERNKLDLEHEKQFIKMLKEDVKALTTSNRNRVDNLHELSEEFYKLEKFLPNEKETEMLSKEGSLRAKLAIAEINRDDFQVDVLVAKNKLKYNQQMLNEIQKKIVDIQTICEKHKQALQQKQENRRIAEEKLKKSHEERSDLVSEQEFLQEQRSLLRQRIKEHESKIKKIKNKTEALELAYRRQMMIKEFNDQRNNLKNCNLEHVANTVEAMLKINDDIGNEIPIPSTTSSSEKGASETDSTI
ncbi:hypothetical protein TRFO_13460 [Tritrichomonas foetus]|uniref:Uncharacterized protein n=1 Tax=Tritrichomonas foetus TaxID=1144522 RepID=A0A1J4L2E5_9EUKA|nr:hypothetical protein TRFO_13460 [Tritrichomonas foetus]|eukprot:OHT16132.1 hypothetical protein TRFO_13460 [Tritrichomonas foetus]